MNLSRLAGNLWCGMHGQPTVLRCHGRVVDARPGVSQELGEPLVLCLLYLIYAYSKLITLNMLILNYFITFGIESKNELMWLLTCTSA